MVNKLKYVSLLFISFVCSTNSYGQIVINSQFRPFSYDEMVAPLQAAANFHRVCTETLLSLMENAEQLEPYINRDKDPISWKRYVDYYNSVVDEYNRIQKNGTNQGTRARINDLKQNFSRVIIGIGNAYNRRNELANNQYQRVRSTNEKCSRWFSEISLDEFLDGNTPTISYY